MERGSSLDRYIVLEPVGAGAMGTVYAAYDPRLDRKVALKLLHGGRADDEALLREARTLARLAHPNVVTVHDAGTHEGRVFLAMELVAGRTLRAWLAERRRSRREILEAFTAAGRGLAAAHQAGLVHRDFKPENALVGEDGRLRVTDFGLARPGPTAPAGGAPETTTAAGTPAYMAPEQFQGLRVGARGDQFSFCVALYEALYGEPPFAPSLPSELSPFEALGVAVLGGRVQPPPAGSDVPQWLRRVLLTGLSVDPGARHPSMPALLAALAADPSARRRRWLAGAAMIAAAAALVVAAARKGEPRSVCAGAARRLDGVWDDGRRAATRAALLGTGVPFAAPAWASVQRLLDGYAAAWVDRHTEVCAATAVRHEQSAAAAELRMRCLDDRLQELRAVVDQLQVIDAAGAERAVGAATGLTPLSGCDALSELAALTTLPTDPVRRAHVEALRPVIVAARVLQRFGRLQPARVLAEAALPLARASGHPASHVELALRAGRIAHNLWDFETARARLEEALLAAESARDDRGRAMAMTELAFVAAWADRDAAAVHRLTRQVEAILARLGDAGAVAVQISDYEADAFELEDHLAEALARRQRTVELARRAFGGASYPVAVTLANMARTLSSLHRYAEAVGVSAAAIALMDQTIGHETPNVARTMVNLAGAMQEAGARQAALPLYDDLVAIMHRTLPDDSPDLAYARNNRGQLLIEIGRPAEAIRPLEQAIEVWQRVYGPDHYQVGEGHYGLGWALLADGRTAAAIPHLERALAIYEKAKAPANELAEVRLRLGQARWEMGRDRREARRIVEQARADLLGERQGEAERWLTAHR